LRQVLTMGASTESHKGERNGDRQPGGSREVL
jgi:hypothetical protein